MGVTNLRRPIAVGVLFIVLAVAGSFTFGMIWTASPAQAEVAEQHVKVYEPAAEAICVGSGLSPSVSYDGYDEDIDQEIYSLNELPWSDSYATGIESSDKDEMLGEVMGELCGNPSALYATIDGLQHTLDDLNLRSSADKDAKPVLFYEENPWAADFMKSADEDGLNQFMDEGSTTDSYRQTVAKVNTLLLRWSNTGVVDKQVSNANWADLSRGQVFGALPKPAQRKAQEDLPALKLTLNDKGQGCVAAIGFNTSDKRFEMLGCDVPKSESAAQEEEPREVIVTPEGSNSERSSAPVESSTPSSSANPRPSESAKPKPSESATPTPSESTTPTPTPTPTPTSPMPSSPPPSTNPPDKSSPPPEETTPPTNPPTTNPPTEETVEPKEPGEDPVNQGNAGNGGGKNEDSGAGEHQSEEPSSPPDEPRTNPAPPSTTTDSSTGSDSDSEDSSTGLEPDDSTAPEKEEEAPDESNPATGTACAPGITNC